MERLLVGGVGIFTIMTIAVRERTQEIGLLRAIGARRSRIAQLFVGEAMLLSGIGTPYDPTTGKGTVGRNYAYQQGGSVEVFFDDMERPVMKAVDKTFSWGQIGVGTFDDTGRFDDLVVHGIRVERPKTN